MALFRHLKIGPRLNLAVSITFAVVILALGWYTIQNQRKKIISDTDTRMTEQVNDLVNFLDTEVKTNQKKVSRGLHVAETLLEQEGPLRMREDATTALTLTDPETGQQTRETVDSWFLGGKRLQRNHAWADQLKEMTGAEVTVFQKTNAGFAAISTTLSNNEGNRAGGVLLPEQADAVQRVRAGSSFQGRMQFNGQLQLAAIQPLRMNGRIQGMLAFTVPEKQLEETQIGRASCRERV